MKKIYLLLLIICPLIFQACLKDQNDLFDKSPSERMDEALSNYKKVLASSDKGWLLEYYPERNQSYGGYNYIIQFTESTVKAHVDIAADISESSDETLYQLIADSGPVISFDTYNSFLHYFATPSSSMYQAYQGDFEFILMGLSDDQNEIRLKGKRSGNTMVLRRMTEDAVSYLTKVLNVEDEITAPEYRINIGNEQFACTLSSRILSFQYPGDDDAIVDVQTAYCVTDKGIRFYEPLDINGVTVDEFILENGRLVSNNGNISIEFVFPPINSVFVASTSQYVFSDFTQFENMSATVKGWLDVAYAGNLAKEGESLDLIYFNYSSSAGRSLVFRSKGSTQNWFATYYYTVTSVEGTEDRVTFGTTYSPGTNAAYYTFFIPVVTNILQEGTYILETKSRKDTSEIKFTSVNNPDIWFVISR